MIFFLLFSYQSFWTANQQFVNSTESCREDNDEVELSDAKLHLDEHDNMFQNVYHKEINKMIPTNNTSSSSLAELLDQDNHFQETRFDFHRFESFQNLNIANTAPYQDPSTSNTAAPISQDRKIPLILPEHSASNYSNFQDNIEVSYPKAVQFAISKSAHPYNAVNENRQYSNYNNDCLLYTSPSPRDS